MTPPARPKALYLLAPEWQAKVYGARERAELDQLVEWVAPPQSPASIAADPTPLARAEVIFAGWGTARMDAAFLAAAPRLQAVFHAGGTVRYFTTDAFWDRHVVLTSGAAINAIPVAEYTLAAVLFSLRDGWHYARRAFADGQFPPRRPMIGAFRATVGLVSLGMIGRLVVERLRPFDLKVLAYDPFVTAAEAAAIGVTLAGLEEIFAQSDVVSLHAPWLKETEGLVTGAHFAAMKPGATFINTARGAIVDEAEMTAVLARRADVTAVLDVTWPEPPVAGSPLYRMPNVILTPHIAGTSDGECERLGRAMVEEFRRWLRREPLVHGITRERAARLA
jgi:phosphoglycerate dehydrogenase-like enzyme